MKLEHVAIWTKDLEAMRSFFETYFGVVAGKRYDNASTGFSSYFLSFDSGSRLEIMTRSDLAGCPAVGMAVGLAHIAIALGNREAVDSLTARLEADGYTVASRPRTTGDGYYESVVLDGEGNRIELTV